MFQFSRPTKTYAALSSALLLAGCAAKAPPPADCSNDQFGSAHFSQDYNGYTVTQRALSGETVYTGIYVAQDAKEARQQIVDFCTSGITPMEALVRPPNIVVEAINPQSRHYTLVIDGTSKTIRHKDGAYIVTAHGLPVAEIKDGPDSILKVRRAATVKVLANSAIKPSKSRLLTNSP
ncbi:MAG: hypothetical protein WAO98_00490 [Alphaproteobacteria bacterium]